MPREVALGSIALASLALGVLVYLTDRAAGSAWLLPPVEALAGRHWFGVVSRWLPSAMHAFAFGLLSAALLPPRPPQHALACASWVLVDAAFELGQHAAIAPRLSAWLESAWPAVFAQPLVRYFRGGTFDPADLGAALLGGVAAWLVLRRVHRSQEFIHGP